MQFVSSASYTLTGSSAEELLQGAPHWNDLIHPDDKRAVRQHLLEALLSGTSFDVEYRVVSPSAGTRWVQERGAGLVCYGGGLVIQGYIADVTDLRVENSSATRASDQNAGAGECAPGLTTLATPGKPSRREAGSSSTSIAEVRAHQLEQLKTLFLCSPTAIVITDATSMILAANQPFAAMLGYEVAELRGKQSTEFVHSEDLDEVKRTASQNLRDGSNCYAGVCRYLHRSGRLIYASISTGIVKDSSGHPTFCIASIEDLTDRILLEIQIREQQSHLVRLDRLSALSEMMAGVAHEINQPLTAISTYAQAGLRFMAGKTPKLERLSEVLEKLSHEALRAGAIVERIREFARQQEGHRELVDCNAAIRGIVDLLRMNLQSARIELQLNLEPDTAAVWCDPVQLQQVMLNLVRNAMDSMLAGELAGGNRIGIHTCMKDEATVQVSVEDEGLGVSGDDFEELIQPFSSHHKAPPALGLAVSRSIVANIGGEIGFVNKPHGGAIFTVSLPAGLPGGTDE